MHFRFYIRLEANWIQSAGSNCFIIRFMNCIYNMDLEQEIVYVSQILWNNLAV